MPARSSLITGRHPHELGINGNQASSTGRDVVGPGLRPDSLGHLLRAAGYDAVYAGKWHARAASAAPEDGFHVLRPFGDAGLATACAQWLVSRSRDSGPFALIASFDEPHTICEFARGQPMPYGDVPPVPVRRTPPLPPNFGSHPYEPEAIRFEQAAQTAVYGTAAYTPDDWRQYRHTYARLVERADARLGQVLDALDASGLAEETLVVLTSDHGDGDAAHAWNQKTALFEETVKVPLIIQPARQAGPGRVSDALVSTGLDLLPTLCAAAGGPTPTGLEGIDLAPLLDGGSGTDRDHIVVETLFERDSPPLTHGRALVTDRYKYVVYSWGRWREQLHDLHDDPGETRNLAVEERYDTVLEEMRARLLEWCLRTEDSAFLKKLLLPASAGRRVKDHIFATPY